MKKGFIHTGLVCVLALVSQGCATGEDPSENGNGTAANSIDIPDDCKTVFHCPADPENIHICQQGERLQVFWLTSGAVTYRLSGLLGQTFSIQYSQKAQVISNILSWQHLDVRYSAYHYLDESRPETLESIGVTVDTNGHSRTISCNDNALSDMARLRQGVSRTSTLRQ